MGKKGTLHTLNKKRGLETLSAFLIEPFWLSVDLKKKKHSSALKRNAESLAVDWGSLRKSLHPVLSREICFLSTRRQKKMLFSALVNFLFNLQSIF